MLRNIILLIAMVIIGLKLYGVVWPIIDPGGVVEQGSYRGLDIGDTKAEVVSSLYSFYQQVRLDGYEIDSSAYTVPTLDLADAPLSASDKWFLIYPGIHKETIVLTFENDLLAAIKYRRDALAP